MKIRCAIVDDEPLAREGLRIQLGRCESFDIDVVGEAGDVPSAATLLSRERPELLFLDISMPRKTGFDLIAERPPEDLPLIIFVTAHAEHAVRAFEADAVDYLLKPVSDRRLDECLRRTADRVTAKEAVARSRDVARLLCKDSNPSIATIRQVLEGSSRHVVVNDSGRRARIACDDIVCVQAAGDYMCITTRDGEVVSRTSLAGLLDALGPGGFIRIHRSTAVNRDWVREIISLGQGRYRVGLGNGIQLTSSRRFRQAIARLRRYLSR